jgi:hypothetical protein
MGEFVGFVGVGEGDEVNLLDCLGELLAVIPHHYLQDLLVTVVLLLAELITEVRWLDPRQ